MAIWSDRPNERVAHRKAVIVLAILVTVPVAEWIGHQLMAHVRARAAAA